MNFINNWSRAITLESGETSCALDLPDGEWRLTLTDAARTRWEIVDANLAAGAATLTRGVEGTADQEWPAGSQIYNAVTAGQLTQLWAAAQQITDLSGAVSDLTARVEALESGGETDGALTDSAGNQLVDGAGNTLMMGE